MNNWGIAVASQGPAEDTEEERTPAERAGPMSPSSRSHPSLQLVRLQSKGSVSKLLLSLVLGDSG